MAGGGDDGVAEVEPALARAGVQCYARYRG